MASVQFPPGVKHTVTAEGVMVVLGHRAGGAEVGVDGDAVRGLPARQYRLSGHWSHRPLSPQTYLPVSDGQLWSPWQGSWWAWLATIQAPRSTMAIRLGRSIGRDITQISVSWTYRDTQRS